MKNKKSIYILLPVVLLIWGVVIYRFFSYSGPEIPEVTESNFSVAPLSIKKPDTFSINVNYRDPFLGKMYMPSKPGNKPAKRLVKAAPTQIMPWPAITYKGIVSDTKDKKKVFMLIIDGKTFLMREKETEEEVTLIKGDRNEITVKHKGRQDQILLKQ